MHNMLSVDFVEPNFITSRATTETSSFRIIEGHHDEQWLITKTWRHHSAGYLLTVFWFRKERRMLVCWKLDGIWNDWRRCLDLLCGTLGKDSAMHDEELIWKFLTGAVEVSCGAASIFFFYQARWVVLIAWKYFRVCVVARSEIVMLSNGCDTWLDSFQLLCLGLRMALLIS